MPTLRALVRSWQRHREPPRPAPAAPLRAGLGDAPAAAASDAGEAELDTLRGELVRELDRRAADDGGPAAFRRVAS